LPPAPTLFSPPGHDPSLPEALGTREPNSTFSYPGYLGYVGVPNLALGKSLSIQCRTKTHYQMAGASRTANSSQQTLPGTNPRVDPFPDFSTRAQDLGPLLSLKRKDHHDRCSVWMVSFAAYFVWRLLQKETLGQAAASVDRRAGLHDEIKTALWFIYNPAHRSGWTRSSSARPEALGRSIRNGSFLAVFPHVLYCGRDDPGLRRIEFCSAALESQLAHIQAAPAFSLTDKEEAALKQAVELLQKAEKLQKTELAGVLKTSCSSSSRARSTRPRRPRCSNDVQSKLDEGNLDLGSINDGLEEIARISRVQT